MLAALRDKEEKAAVRVKINSWLGRVVGAQGRKRRAEFMELGRVRDMMPGRDKDCVCVRVRGQLKMHLTLLSPRWVWN